MPQRAPEYIAHELRDHRWQQTITSGNHIKYTHPSGAFVFGSATTGDKKSWQQLAKNLRHARMRAVYHGARNIQGDAMQISQLDTPTARQLLGKLLADHRTWSKMTPERVASILGVTVEQLAAFETGESVPTPAQWVKYGRNVHRGLSEHGDVYQQAQHDASSEAARRRFLVSVPPPAPPPQPEPAAVVELSPTPPPTTEEPSPMPVAKTKRPGLRDPENVAARRAYCEQLIRANPKISPDDAHEALVKKFGAGVGAAVFYSMRTEITGGEKGERFRRKSPTGATTPAAKMREQLESAAQLVLDAVPNLASFTIERDIDGNVRIGYKVRTVVESAGLLKLKR